MPIDLTEDVARPAADITKAVEAANQILYLQDYIAKLEDHLKARNEELRKLQTETLPDIMDSLELKEFILSSGAKVSIKPFVSANLPAKSSIEKADEDERPLLEDRLEKGLKWLRMHKAADLIKNQIKVDLGMGHNKHANALMKLVKKLKLTADRSEFVHPGTLVSFIKERLEGGKEVPMDIFNVSTGRKADVPKPKKEKLSGSNKENNPNARSQGLT